MTSRNLPVQVRNLSNITAVEAGDFHSAALRGDGTVWTWGRNNHSQLGDGTHTHRNTPVQVRNLSNMTAIAVGGGHTAALRNDGTVWAWGDNRFGQLGDGTTSNRTAPVRVHNLSNITAISAGATYTMALRNDGTVWAWGENVNGQLGDGTWTARNIPVRVRNLTNVTAIVAGCYHAVARRSDGTVWTWGLNGTGQLGDGTPLNRNAPTQARNINNVIAACAGCHHSVVLRNDGTVWAWGRNEDGQLGDNTMRNRSTPVQVRGPGNVGFLNLDAHSQPSIWAVEQVNAAIAAGLVPQDLQSNYLTATTRAEFATLAVRLYENRRGEIRGRVTFTDTADVNVQKAAYIGVVLGVGNNRFAPNETVTREQAAVMLARLADRIGRPLPHTAPTFADNHLIADWALAATGRVQAVGIMGGVGNNRFAPLDTYTREQSIVTIMRLFDFVR